MHTINHLMVGVASAYILGLNQPLAVTFILASVLIDVDHVIEIKIPKNKIQIKHLFNVKKYKKEINYNSPQKALHIFHTFEIILVLYLISFFNKLFFWIASAFFIHLITDAVGNIINRNFGKYGGKDWIKYWFLFYYIKNKSIFNKENF